MSLVRFARSLLVLTAGSAAMAALGSALCWYVITTGRILEMRRFVPGTDGLAVVDRHGTPLRFVRRDGVDRRWVPLREISPHLIDAVIATEDRDFRVHRGVDFRAVARAAFTNLLPWTRRSGASTITQQVVKLAYGRDGSVRSKFMEALRAVALERILTKDEILEQYLNRVPCGNSIEGVARASEGYFGHSVANLTVAEAALLAGVPQAPTQTEPRRHRQRALSRRNLVLRRMAIAGFIDTPTLNAALQEPIVIRDEPPHPFEAARFVDAAVTRWRNHELHSDYGVLATSIDWPLQRRAEEILRASVDGFESRGARNAAGIVVANDTGEVLAYVGAAREEIGDEGGALDLLEARRQPGSTLKPFVYTLLFERGASAATLLDDVSSPMTGARATLFEPRDYDGRERGPVRAREALSGSLNLAAIDAARRVGADAIVNRLRALGVTGLRGAAQYGPAVVVGGADVSAVELASAYVTLARGGSAIPLSFGRSAQTVEGRVVMNAGAAEVTWNILSDSAARRDAFGADLVDLAGGAFALKTGTSSGWRDAWAAAATDRFVVVVWVGHPAGAAMAEVSGFAAAAPAAARILSAANARAVVDGIAPHAPPDVPWVETAVCAWSGLRAGPHCEHAVTERFVRGTEPHAVCQAHTRQGSSAVVPSRYADWVARVHPAGVALETHRDSCGSASPEVHEPRAGRVLLGPSSGSVSVPLRAWVCGAPATDVTWEIDGQRWALTRWTLRPGTHRIVAIRHGVHSAVTTVEVRAPEDGS